MNTYIHIFRNKRHLAAILHNVNKYIVYGIFMRRQRNTLNVNFIASANIFFRSIHIINTLAFYHRACYFFAPFFSSVLLKIAFFMMRKYAKVFDGFPVFGCVGALCLR